MKIAFDPIKSRLISGGADSHLKFHDLDSEKVMYNIKLPSELASFDISSDGKHYSIGMADGTFLVRSKKFTKEYTETGEEIVD
jgi:WD40 repeat protein